jgi:hypothetical protein
LFLIAEDRTGDFGIARQKRLWASPVDATVCTARTRSLPTNLPARIPPLFSYS